MKYVKKKKVEILLKIFFIFFFITTLRGRFKFLKDFKDYDNHCMLDCTDR